MCIGYQPAYWAREVPQALGIPVLRLPTLGCAGPDLWLDTARTAAANGQRIQISTSQESKPPSLQGIEKLKQSNGIEFWVKLSAV